jgi:glyoxylase-like metal-dependent hydrolase (beta-lactamase superfamily II)
MSQNARVPDVPGTVERVTDQVARIPLPLPMPDLKVVNTYAIRGSDGVTLVDPGWANTASESILVNGLRQLGYVPGDVRRILVTHAHWDHYTQAVKWQRQLGAQLLLGHRERHTIEAFHSLKGVYPNQVRLLRRAGAAALADEVARMELEPHERDMPVGPPDIWLRGGEEIDCAGRTIIAHATPGHTRGHIVFEDPGDGLLFTGDHILPRITPSIGFERAPDHLALRSYLDSLQLVLQLPDARMLPAHGGVGAHTRARAQELIDHHEHRLKTVIGLIAAGAETAYGVGCQMKWTRRERTITELGTVHRMTAVLEVLAHLELLVTRGLLCSDDSGPARRYQVTRTEAGEHAQP